MTIVLDRNMLLTINILRHLALEEAEHPAEDENPSADSGHQGQSQGSPPALDTTQAVVLFAIRPLRGSVNLAFHSITWEVMSLLLWHCEDLRVGGEKKEGAFQDPVAW